MRLVSSFAALCVFVVPSFAAAQPSSGSVFISAAAFAAVEKAPTSAGFGVPESDSGGTVAGGGLGIGLHLTDRVTARFEWSMTDTLTQRSEAIIYPYVSSYDLGAFTSGGLQGIDQLSLVPYTPEMRRDTAAGFALLGYHLPAGRASIEVMGGLGLLSERVQQRYDVRIANRPAGLSLPAAPAYESSSYHAVAVVGADVAVSLTTHAAVVPHVRAYARQGGLSLRPGLALRWTF